MGFGELLYALEYRNRSVESMYTIGYDNGICLPHNLCIIGTMDMADRSARHILGFDYDKVIPAFIIYPTINGNDLDLSPKFLKSDYRYVNIYKCSIKLPTMECR